MLKLTLVPTLKSRTKSFPLMVTDCPVPSRTVSVLMLMVFVNTITPLQANDTLPPPANAASRLAWSQFVTVPPANDEFAFRQQNPINSQTNSGEMLLMRSCCAGLEGSSDEMGFAQRTG